MSLNIAKCSIMTFGRLREPYHFQYAIDGQLLKLVSVVKDLGVTFVADLTFDNHIDDICSRANRLLGFLFRSTRGLSNTWALRTLFCSLVRQLLEYACPVWSPHLIGQIGQLESIQRKFLRLVGVRQGLQYRDVPVAQMQENLNLQDLRARRCASDMVFLSKLVTGLIDCPALLSEVDIRVPSGTRSQDLFGRRHYARGYLYHGPLARMLRNGNVFCATFDIFTDSQKTIRKRVLADFHRSS